VPYSKRPGGRQRICRNDHTCLRVDHDARVLAGEYLKWASLQIDGIDYLSGILQGIKDCFRSGACPFRPITDDALNTMTSQAHNSSAIRGKNTFRCGRLALQPRRRQSGSDANIANCGPRSAPAFEDV
jgi:hypothetical protein